MDDHSQFDPRNSQPTAPGQVPAGFPSPQENTSSSNMQSPLPPPIQGPQFSPPSQPAPSVGSFIPGQQSAQPSPSIPSQPVYPNSSAPQPSASLPPKSIPDLTATQQVMSPFPEAVAKQPAVTAPASVLPPPPKPPVPSANRSGGFPKPLLFIIGGFAILFVLFLIFKILGSSFSGAGSNKVTLTYWGLWEDTNVMQGVISDFEREHPNISVKYSKQDPHEYSKSVLTRIQNGNGPDIFRYHVSWIPMLLPSLLPLSTDAISKSEFTKSYYPVMQQDLIKNGAIYGIPLEVDTLSLYVNKKIFTDAHAQVPTTWDGFITTAQGLTKKDDGGKITQAGAALGTYGNITHAPDIISLLLVQNGVDLNTITPASNAGDALTFYTSFAKDQDSVWDSTLDPSMLSFERGKLAMYIGYSWDLFAIKAVSPDLDFAVYPVPHLPGRETTIASYWVEGVSSKTTHPQAAMLFMHFLAQKDTAAKLYTAEAKTRPFGEPYANVDSASLLKNNPLVYPFVEQATNASSSFFSGETQDTGINGQMNQYIGNAVNSMLKDTSADSAVDTLTKGVSSVLSQYGQQ